MLGPRPLQPRPPLLAPPLLPQTRKTNKRVAAWPLMTEDGCGGARGAAPASSPSEAGT